MAQQQRQKIAPERVYQTYLAERKKQPRGAYVRTGAIYGRSDEWARQVVKAHEASTKSSIEYASVIKVFNPAELAYIPAPLEVEYQHERDRLAQSLRTSQENAMLEALICQEMPELAKSEDTALDSDIWQTDANNLIAFCQVSKRDLSHFCRYPQHAKWYSCAYCFGPGLGSAVGIMWVIVGNCGLFLAAAAAHYGRLVLPVLVPLSCMLACWIALACMLTGAYLDSISGAWRLWFSAIGLLLFIVGGIALGL